MVMVMDGMMGYDLDGGDDDALTLLADIPKKL